MVETITIKINGTLLKCIVLIIPIFIFFSFQIVKMRDYPTYVVLVNEDHIVEYMTSIIYFISSLIAFYVAIKFFRCRFMLFGILYALFATALFVFFGEEISWGQRLMGMHTTGFFAEHNLQREVNLHNLDFLRGVAKWFYIVIGFGSILLWIVFTRLKNRSSFLSEIHRYVIPEWYLCSYFLMLSLVYIVISFMSADHNLLNITFRELEPSEFTVSIGFFLFAVIKWLKQVQTMHGNRSHWIHVESSHENR